MNLICLPYAGATAMNYLKWKKLFDEDVQLIPVDPPGRGKRISEKPSISLANAVTDILGQVIRILDNTDEPYALYGHSMGSLLAYELLCKLREKHYSFPKHVFLSGRNPPHYPIPYYVNHLEDKEFIIEILKYGGTPDGFFDNKELAKLFLPILRADYKMVEEYNYVPQPMLPVDITFFYSQHDKGISMEWINRWKELIDGEFKVHTFEGGHFFINEKSREIVNIMNTQLEEIKEEIFNL